MTEENGYSVTKVIMDEITGDIIKEGDYVLVKHYVLAPIPEVENIVGRVVGVSDAIVRPSSVTGAGFLLDCSAKYQSSIRKVFFADIQSVERIDKPKEDPEVES